MTPALGRAGQQEQLDRVVRRFAEVAPAGWVRLVGNWEAYAGPAGELTLDYLTLAVVDAGDRWQFGQVGYDEPLYDLVADLHRMAAAGAPGHAWTVLDLEVDQDQTFRAELGYDPPKRARGIHDEESMGRFETYLDRWVAEHGPRPTGRWGRDVTPEQQSTLDEIVTVYRDAAPDGWLRIVCRWECELAPDGLADSALTHVVIVVEGGELAQVQFPSPDALTFVRGDWHEELTRATARGALSVDLLIDRDDYALTFTEEPSKMLHGDWADSDRRVHEYLERHRDELAALAGQ